MKRSTLELLTSITKFSPSSIVVDEGGLAWALPCQAKWHGEIDHCRGEHWWCTPAMSVSSVTSGVRREWFPLGDKRDFLHVIALSISETTFGAYFRRDV
jgi:hypothetical protein